MVEEGAAGEAGTAPETSEPALSTKAAAGAIATASAPTPEQETKTRNWFGYSVGYQYSNSHFISLFYGKRRGGTACTAGICYEVLPFEGFELRLSSNL